MARYRKSIAALIGGLGTWWAASYQGGIDGAEQGALLVFLSTVVAVWGLPNDAPAGRRPRRDVSERG